MGGGGGRTYLWGRASSAVSRATWGVSCPCARAPCAPTLRRGSARPSRSAGARCAPAGPVPSSCAPFCATWPVGSETKPGSATRTGEGPKTKRKKPIVSTLRLDLQWIVWSSMRWIEQYKQRANVATAARLSERKESEWARRKKWLIFLNPHQQQTRRHTKTTRGESLALFLIEKDPDQKITRKYLRENPVRTQLKDDKKNTALGSRKKKADG